jgi:GT2 family glycosyltransferase
MTKEFISSIQKIDYSNKRLIIVDDGSKDNSGIKLKQEFKHEIEVIFTNRYIEYCKAFNFGIRHAINTGDADYFFIINNDTKNFSSDYFKVANKAFENISNIGKFGSAVFDYEGKRRGGGDLMYKLGIELVTPTEGYIIPRKVFEEIGLFDEALTRYFEDLDFIKRLHDNGYITHSDTSISFDHLGGGTTKNKPYVRNFYRVRNLLWFIKRYGKSFSLKEKFNYFKSYGGTHYYNFIKPIKALKLITSLRVLFSIIFGLIMGIFTNWNPKTALNK